ncbi:hypothetical protein [Legionella massiliensis]|nr:hypothetical protein [Legionella massiliensis]
MHEKTTYQACLSQNQLPPMFFTQYAPQYLLVPCVRSVFMDLAYA